MLPDQAEDRWREHFAAAAAGDPAGGGRAADIEILTALGNARIERLGEVPYGSNAVFVLELDAADPSRPDARMRAIYKPARGERPLWDFPRHTLYLREVATYLVDAALGLGHVPPTTLRDGPVGPGSVQLFVHAATKRPAAAQSDAVEAQLRNIAALDVLVNNADRKRSHLMITDSGWIRAIDNALTFLPYPRQRTALIALGGQKLSDDAFDRVSTLAKDRERLPELERRLGRLLSAREVTAFVHRVSELAGDPTYPVLDEWDGRPFEWW